MTDAVAYLSGAQDSGAEPFAIGRKFDAQGQRLSCPGNTTLCHVAPESAAHAALVAVQEAMQASQYADCFTFLPPASFHMTIFEGIIDYARMPARWPAGIALDSVVTDVTEQLRERMQDCTLPRSFDVRAERLFGGFSVRMAGANKTAEADLRFARDTLRDATQIRRPDHDSYAFHITLGYLLRWLTPEDAADLQDLADSLFERHLSALTFELGPVEFCSFETMHRFECLERL